MAKDSVELAPDTGSTPSVMPGQIAELIEILLRELNARMYRSELNPAQWSALRYFSRDNGQHRTLTDFARFHASTRGTASQTISALQRKGLVTRTPVPKDARQVAVCVTDRGRAVLSKDPLASLTDCIGRIPDDRRLAFALIIKDLLFNLYGEKQ